MIVADRTSPLASSTSRCRTIVERVVSSGRARSLTDAGPRYKRSTIARRAGSASAWNVASSVGTQVTTFLGYAAGHQPEPNT